VLADAITLIARNMAAQVSIRNAREQDRPGVEIQL
jgi:hypothetical protein